MGAPVSVRLGCLALLAAVLTGCSEDDDHPHEHAHLDDSHAEHDWSYADAGEWDETCASGSEQSPIDLADAAPENLAEIEFDYGPADATVVDNGHSVQTTFEDGGSITLDGETYRLAQFHFHTPSEHHLEGAPYAAEMHLVHQAEDGGLAVVGVLVEEGAPNPLVATVLDSAPEEGDDAAELDQPVDPAALLPGDLRAYRYAGSLTTPPCTEGVAWSVLSEPVTWSAGQVTAFAARHPDSHRPPQPLGERVLVHDSR